LTPSPLPLSLRERGRPRRPAPHSAAIRVARGSPGSAMRLWAAAEALREEIGAPLKDPERARYEPLVAKARDALGEEAFAKAWAEGRRHTPERALDVR